MKGYLNSSSRLVWQDERDFWLASIRDERRFKKLMQQVKHEWEHFEV